MSEAQQFVSVKLAAALSIRKSLMTAGQINHNVPLEQTVITDTEKFRGVDKAVEELMYYPIMEVIGPLQYNKLATQIVDAAIHQANTNTRVTIPTAITNGEFDTKHDPREVAWAGAVETMLDIALLRRTYLEAMVGKLKYYVDSAVKEPHVVEARQVRSAVGMNVPDNRITVKDNSFLRAEAVRALNFYSARLQKLDNIIQEKNWSVDVVLPGWVQDHYNKVPKKTLKTTDLPGV